jgi:hypothetical protein
MAVSYGSNDMANWEYFARILHQEGLSATYEAFPRFNHPPLAAWMALLASKVSAWSGIPFRLTWKLHELLADLLALARLWRHFAPRGPLGAAAAVAIFGCNPVSIAVSAFHGNTDSLCAMLALWAALLHGRARFATAGLALAAAVNVKVVALLLVPGRFLLCATPRQALRLAAGLALGSLPIVWALCRLPAAFYENVFGYASQIDAWGVERLGAAQSGDVPRVLPVLDPRVSSRREGRHRSLERRARPARPASRLEHVARDSHIDVGISVHQDVAKPGGRAQPGRKVLGDAPGAFQDVKQLSIGLGFTQAIVGYDVGGRVEARLYGELQRVLDKPPLLDIALQIVWSSQTAQIGDAAFDEGELLLEQIGVRHATRRDRRYRSRNGFRSKYWLRAFTSKRMRNEGSSSIKSMRSDKIR